MFDSAASRSKVDILLVDDREDGLLTLQAVLVSPDYNLVTARSGEEALAHLLVRDFAVILLDVQMPGMDGFETARVVKQRERSKHIPIIFVTAIHRDAEYIFRGYGIGAVDYLVKPFDPDALRLKVAVFAELFRRSRRVEQQAELLRASEEKYRAVLEAARDTVATLSTERKILNLSPAFEAMTGWKAEDCLGLSLDDLLHPEDRSAFNESFSLALKGIGALAEARLMRKDGNYLTMEASAKPLFEQGQPTGIITVLRDVTERKRTEKQRRRQDELERSNQELEQFAHVCSHDLQEPLRNIRTQSQFLEKALRGSLDENTQQTLDLIMDSSARMSQLIRDLLTFSSLDSSDLTPAELSSHELCDQAVRSLSIAVEESRATITQDPLPVVLGSRSLLIQVFQNLIGNAIKFRGSDTPAIHISAVRQEEDWLFSVRDNGIGFKMVYAQRIFSMFQRLHHRRDFPGTGAGLAICKRIIERHGGRIWAESSVGGGATFLFTLPGATERVQEALSSGLTQSDSIHAV